MRWRTCLVLLSVGLGILIAGFMYDLFFAGIPYQGSPPAIQAQYLRHMRIARSIETIGMMLWALGVINVVLSYVHTRVAKKQMNGVSAGRP